MSKNRNKNKGRRYEYEIRDVLMSIPYFFKPNTKIATTSNISYIADSNGIDLMYDDGTHLPLLPQCKKCINYCTKWESNLADNGILFFAQNKKVNVNFVVSNHTVTLRYEMLLKILKKTKRKLGITIVSNNHPKTVRNVLQLNEIHYYTRKEQSFAVMKFETFLNLFNKLK